MTSKNSKFCSHCGTSVKDDDVFCNNCGASIDETIEPVGSSPIQQQPYTQTVYPQQQTVLVDGIREPRNIVAIVSMVLGIIALGFSFVWFLCCVSIPFQIAAFITGIIGVIRKKRRYFAVAGLGLAVVAFTMFLLQRFGVFYLY